MNNRWSRCVLQRGQAVENFVAEFLNDPARSLLLVAGGGFDPRTTRFPQLLAKFTRPSKRALVIREERHGAAAELVADADRNTEQLCHFFADCDVRRIQVFAPDNAVIGGREVAALLAVYDLSGITDVIIDISALSTGVYFPAVKVLLKRVERIPDLNLHAIVSEDHTVDNGIVSVAGDRAAPVHGFWGSLGLDENSKAARLWIPQLTFGRRSNLERIHRVVDPDDICPILPFPSKRPRLPDVLVEEYRELLLTWKVDLRNVLYAAENNPLDLYKTVLRLVDVRKRAFAETGGSLVVLSPASSKLLSVGALLAALERELPVCLVEAVAYEMRHRTPPPVDLELVHIWLHSNGMRCNERNIEVRAGNDVQVG